MSGSKQKGTATYMRFVGAVSGTVDIFTESRTLEVQEQANRIDVTVRGDTAKANLAEVPDVTVSVGGLDYIAGTVTPTPEWDKIAIGEEGTVFWAPEGTAAGRRKRSLACILQNKNYSSPYDNVAEWTLEFASNGGTVVQGVWP